MHTSIWIKIAMALGFSFIGLFAINGIGDWMGGTGGGHTETEQVADASHSGTAPVETSHDEAAPREEAAPLGNVAAEPDHADTASGDSVAADDADTVAPASSEDSPAEQITAAVVTGDAEAGAKAAKRKCGTCHTFAEGQSNRTGPNLFGVTVRQRASAEGYKYSSGMKQMGGFWSDADLDAYLTDPKGFVKGSKMSFKTRKPEDRADLIAWLKTLQ